jgi:hypothetical protein
MINYFRTRVFVAGIMAEIKAQYSAQKFVNSLITLVEVCDFLKDFREKTEYMNDEKKYYLASFGVLAKGAKSVEWPFEQRKIAMMLLQERLIRASNGELQHKYKEYFESIIDIVEVTAD